MEKFAKPGDFCPNEACPDYGKLQDGQRQRNIRKYGKTRSGIQRYQCQTCRRTFTETIGTIFYRKRTPEWQILETLALLAEGSRISSLSRAKGIKEDTILAWLREAAQKAAGSAVCHGPKGSKKTPFWPGCGKLHSMPKSWKRC